MHEYKAFYRRKLPHLHAPNQTLFVTFRLAGSIPQAVLRKYKNERLLIEHQVKNAYRNVNGELTDTRSEEIWNFHRRWFRKFEDILHKEGDGPVWLKQDEIASIVYDAFMHRNKREYDLRALCIMSNHVHSVFKPLLDEASLTPVREVDSWRLQTEAPTLGRIMKSLKGYTARMANRDLGRTGQFWEVESYDHQVRSDAELFRIVSYVLQNPVKAGLVNDWTEWPWTYMDDELRPYFE